MAQGRRARMADEEPAESRPIGFETLAGPPAEDSGYLPSRDDQSWRELEALVIAAGHEESAELTADQDGEPQDHDPEIDEYDPEPESTGRGLGSVMLLMAAVAALVVVALAFPDMLTAGFWRAHREASPAKPASAPARVANVPDPAPPLERLRPPAPANGPGVNPGLNSEPAANAMPEAAPRPAAPASGRDEGGGSKTMVIGRNGSVKYVDAGSKAGLAPAAPDDRGTGGVYAMAPGPDGVLRYQYFPSRREPDSQRAARPPSRDDDENNGDDDSGGVYAMAPGPDGKLEYQYFPPEPSR